MAPNNQKFKIGLLNPGSLSTKHEEFIVAIEHHRVDLMALNETWLRPGEVARAPTITNYQLRHVPRNGIGRKRGGGVGFYIRNGVTTRICENPINPPVEQMWLKITLNRVKLIVGTAYRPPWLDIDIFFDALTDSISSFGNFDYIILLGDFNINLLIQDSHYYKFYSFMQYFNLVQYVSSPTHFTDHSQTLIDVICSNMQLSNIIIDHIPSLSNHAFLTCEISVKKPKLVPRHFFYRPLKNINLDAFQANISCFQWDEIASLTNVNDMVRKFNDTLLQIYDLYAPVKYAVIKRESHPWITDTVREMIKLRNKAFQRFKMTKLKTHEQYYKNLKKTVRSAIYNEKKAYFTHYVNYNFNNPSVLWKNIKLHINFSARSGSEIPNHLLDANNINDYFCNIPGQSEASASEIDYFESNKFCSASFELKAVDEAIVGRVIKSLKSNAQGDDGITLDMLILTLPHTLPVITAIINTSILTSTFPNAWKTALVTPLPKTNNVLELKDLRPISILPFISKILEKVVNTQLVDYIESNNLLPIAQSGFRRGRSTVTALANVVDDILYSQDKGEGTILVLLDYSRAFDSINIPLLISKLRYYGFSRAAVEWFSSYLNGRSQVVKINDVNGCTIHSSPRELTRGVPQGSILAPTLYIMNTADIGRKIEFCNYHLYADDIQLYLSFNPSETHNAISKINADLYNITTWSKANTLVLNPNKSKYIILGSNRQIECIINKNPTLKIMGESVERVLEARNLGVNIDSSLHFESHILEIARNCFYRLKVLYRVRDFVSEPIRIKLCDSLILSKFSYADTVYGPGLLARTARVIQRVQNACARFIFHIPPRTHVTPYLNTANILRMSLRRQLSLATLVFGVIKTCTPEYLFRKLYWRKENSTQQVRAVSKILTVPKHHSAAFRGSFRYAATMCWNNLPPPLRQANSVCSFKRNLKKILFSLQKHEINVGGRTDLNSNFHGWLLNMN